MMKPIIMVAVTLIAVAAAAQLPVTGNSPASTLARPTGGTSPTTLPLASAVSDPVTKTAAQLTAEKYRTQVVCRSTVETGSLIARHKACLTRKQWQYVDDAHETEARRMMDNMSRPNCDSKC